MDLGASRRGVDMGPSALRVADLARRLEALGHAVEADDDVSAPLPRCCAPAGCATRARGCLPPVDHCHVHGARASRPRPSLRERFQ
jgi:arginase